MNHSAVIVICSTLESKRLSRKALRKIAGVPAIRHIFERIKTLDIPAILAIPENTSWDYEQALHGYNYKTYIGQSSSPLHRIERAVRSYYSDYLPQYVIRITHDDILVDAETLKSLLDGCIQYGAGYGITPKIVNGAGVEVIKTANLLHAAKTHTHPVEHVSYFVQGDNCPNTVIYWGDARPAICRDYRLTLDYPEDLIVLEAALSATSPYASNDDICRYLDEHPHVLQYNRQPRVTLYTCVYNNQKYIADTISSVFNSGFQDYEYIIVNDGSNNDTLAEILRCIALCPGKVRVITNETNQGLASSSNIAIEAARGEYVMRIDADDKICPNAIERMLEKMRNDKGHVCYANYTEIDAQGNILQNDCDAAANHHAGCAMMNKKAVNEIKFRDGLRHWDGKDLHNRIKGKLQIVYAKEPLWMYRVHGESMSRNNLEERQKALKGIV